LSRNFLSKKRRLVTECNIFTNDRFFWEFVPAAVFWGMRDQRRRVPCQHARAQRWICVSRLLIERMCHEWDVLSHQWECVTNKSVTLNTRPPPAHRKNGSRLRDMKTSHECEYVTNVTNESARPRAFFCSVSHSWPILSMRRMSEYARVQRRNCVTDELVRMEKSPRMNDSQWNIRHEWERVTNENASRKSEYARVQRRNRVTDELVRMEKSSRMNDSQWRIRYEWECVTNEWAPLRQRALIENVSRINASQWRIRHR